MNAIIWWLESPWQLRALVFILSFFVCFVGPWLHSQSLLTSRVAAKRSLEETSEAASAPKAESLLQQNETQAKAPAPEERVSVDERAPVQVPPAPTEVTKAPVQEEQASAPQASVQAPAPIEPKAPTEEATKTPVEQELAPTPTEAPLQAAPAIQEQVPPPVEPTSPSKQEQAAVQAPAAPAQPAPLQFAGGFNFIQESANVIPTPVGSVLDKQDFAVSTEKGGSAEVEVHILPIKAGWDLRRTGRLVEQPSSRTDLSAFLDSNALGQAVARYDTVVCVGLGSRRAPLSTQEITRLIDNRAVQLCGIIARKPYVSENAKFYGLPLGQQLDTAPSEKDRADRSLILIGIINAKGDLADAATQRKMIAEFVRGNRIADFPLSNFSEVASGKELRYIEVKGGSMPYKSKPVRSSAVKPGYTPQQDAPWLRRGLNRPKPTVVRKRCGARIAARVAPSARRKVPKSRAHAETLASTTPRRCSIFDFPF